MSGKALLVKWQDRPSQMTVNGRPQFDFVVLRLYFELFFALQSDPRWHMWALNVCISVSLYCPRQACSSSIPVHVQCLVYLVLFALLCNNNRNNDKGRHTPAAWLVYIFVRNVIPPGTTCWNVSKGAILLPKLFQTGTRIHFLYPRATRFPTRLY